MAQARPLVARGRGCRDYFEYGCDPRWRRRPMVVETAASAGTARAVMAWAASSRWPWLSLSWTSRWLPVARAAANVFLGVHGAEGEQASGQAQSGDHVLGSSAAERRLTTRTSGCQAVRAETAVPDPLRSLRGRMKHAFPHYSLSKRTRGKGYFCLMNTQALGVCATTS